MTITKADIVQAIANETGFAKNKSVKIVDHLLEILKETLTDGDDLLISGFGKFCVRQKTERRGKNPATGKEMMLRPRKVVTFKCSGKLRDRCNGRV